MMGAEVKGAWRVNSFLFLLTGSQSVLLPWSPVILKATGLSGAAVGIIMAVITLAGSIGVCSCLLGMKRTNSGAARRLMLLLLTITAPVIHLTAVLMLPPSAGGNTCMLSSATIGARQNSAVYISDKEITFSKGDTTLAVVIDLTTLPQLQQGSTEMTKESNYLTTNNKNSQSFASSHTAKGGAGSESNSTNSSESKTTSKIDGNSLDSNAVSSQKLTSKLKPTDSVFKTNVTPNTTIGKADIVKLNNTEHFAGTLNVSQPTTSSHLSKQVTDITEAGKISGTSQATLKSHTLSQDASSPTKLDEIEISQKASTNLNQQQATAGKNEKNSPTSDNEVYKTDNFYGEDYEYYDYPNSNPNSSSSLPKDSATHRVSLAGNQGKSLENPPPPPPPPPPPSPPAKVSHHKKGKSWISNNGFQSRDRNPSQRFDIPLEIEAQDVNDYGSVSFQDKKLNNRMRLGKGQNSPFAKSKYHGYGMEAEEIKVDNGYEPKQPGKGSRGLGRFQDRYYSRNKRSVQRFDQGLQHKIEKHDLEDKEDTQTENLRNSSHHEGDVNIRGIMEHISSPVGIRTGVAILLILGSLVGAGIEVGVAKLWHCYAHGYDEGGVNQDILQRTIAHTFQLSVYSSHKVWSGLTSGAWVVGGGFIASVICMMGVNAGIFGMLGGIHLALGLCTVFIVLVIPVPYGSMEPPKTKRPLSLYLDDEVLREGVRRLAFHIWVLVNGCVTGLPVTFSLWVILEMTQTQGSAMAAQTGAVAVTLAAESLTLQAQRCLVARLGLQGTMGVGGLALMLHLALVWASKNVAMVVISHVGLGCTVALLWVSVRHNALLLATVDDQEREAWASWWCWRVGLGIGSAVWGALVDVRVSVVNLFKPASFIAASLALVVATAAVMTRRQGRTRRRVYHTLDLDMAGEDDEDDEVDDANEDDWLVKRAKKEGLNLG